MALRLCLHRCLSASSKTLSAPAFSAPPLAGVPSKCRLSGAPLAILRPRPGVRPFFSSPLCRVTFNVQDEDDFKERVLKSSTPVIVDFHAQWCGPCKILAPRLEKLVAKQDGKLLMAKVDIDDHTDLALKYEVSAVPTVVAVKNGAVVDKFVGLKEEGDLEAFLKRVVGSGGRDPPGRGGDENHR